jgi:hypothetical protein
MYEPVKMPTTTVIINVFVRCVHLVGLTLVMPVELMDLQQKGKLGTPAKLLL